MNSSGLPAAAWKLVPMGFTTATTIAEQRGDIVQITTGCKELDSILEGKLSATNISKPSYPHIGLTGT